VHTILREGTGADRQLAVYREKGDLQAVVDYLADETVRDVVAPTGLRPS
jgi:carboxylate-amine ligase